MDPLVKTAASCMKSKPGRKHLEVVADRSEKHKSCCSLSVTCYSTRQFWCSFLPAVVMLVTARPALAVLPPRTKMENSALLSKAR
ncbi:hypothetical protein TNCV_5044151 [Trichonephila clavipes]|uniref:Uncharacterized protein n=1 Tax=Trichonephila clavipes TaxID=2585209 RepID=A0A8X7BKY2_TRICX|nr:hypothetical protein TNCV_5044151 [Trichonephila clavipes]